MSTFRTLLTRRSGGYGDVLFTSRRADLDRLGTLLEIPPMTTEEGVRLLLRGYGNENIQQHTQEGSRIVTRLGGLALAIDQAAAYIKYKRMPLERLAEFATTYETQRQKILEYTPKKFWEYGTMQLHEEAEQKKGISAFATWEMSFQQLELHDASTKDEVAHFLTLSAFFDPAKIGESLFRHHWEADGSRSQWMYIFSATEDVDSDDNLSPDGGSAGQWDSGDLTSRYHPSPRNETGSLALQSRGMWDSERFWDVIAQSYELSLLQNIISDVREGASFSLHPLIRDWLQLREKAEARRKYTKEGVDIVLSSIKEYETRIATPEENLVLMAHMDASLANDAQFSKPQNRLGRDLANCDTARSFAHFYEGQGRYLASERLTRLIMETQGSKLGEEHPDTLVSMNDMAQVLSDLGKYAEAEKMNRRTLNLRETILGKEHPDTLTSMSNLAKALEQQNEYDEAEEINQRVLEAREKVLGKMHLDTLISVTIQGYLLRHRGNYIEAEKMHRRALEGREKKLGQEHPDTLESLNNLAYVMSCQRNYELAGETYRRVLETRKKVLGPEHPRTLGSINNLAYVLARGGKYAQAEDMYRYVLTARTRVLGSQHPKTLKSENNLFWVLLYQGKDKEADNMNRTVTEELTL
jgi:tetratricopeptide (TPR) repeat protein